MIRTVRSACIRVMGFRPVASHDHGELNCTSRRITLVLDLKSSYQAQGARQLGVPLSHGALARCVPPQSGGVRQADCKSAGHNRALYPGVVPAPLVQMHERGGDPDNPPPARHAGRALRFIAKHFALALGAVLLLALGGIEALSD